MIATSWLRELVDAGLPEHDRLRVGLAGLAFNELPVAHEVAGIARGAQANYDGSQEYRDLPRVLTNFIGAMQQNPSTYLYKHGAYVLPLSTASSSA